MNKLISEIRQIIDEFTIRITGIPDFEFSAKTTPGKWSRKEVLGHLTDSAQNNLRRFICGQYESSPRIVYDEDFWVNANNYGRAEKQTVIEGWRQANESICRVLSSMAQENYDKTCNTGKDAVQLRTLEWLAADYVKHMKHHLNQILPGSFDIVYP